MFFFSWPAHCAKLVAWTSTFLLFTAVGQGHAEQTTTEPTRVPKSFTPRISGDKKASPAVPLKVPTIALPPSILLDAARWQKLEGAESNDGGQASWRRATEQTVAVRGALATPLAVGSLQRADLRGSLRFYVPRQCPDWTSLALALYGSNNTRTYAMAVFKRPDSATGNGELQVEGSTRINFTFKPATWYTLSLQVARKTLAFKVWPDGDAEPGDWQVRAGVKNTPVDRVGVRTYGDEIEVSSLTLAGRSGQIPALDRSLFPQPIFEREPGYVDLYWKACELAGDHVLEQPGIPQPRYMDEALWDDTIWIWDTCFMSLYSRYAPRALPGLESLQNFYAPIHDGVRLHVTDSPINLIVQHPDNPPLFAWAEWQSYQITGDKAHLRWLLRDKKYLQKHYEWFNTIRRGQTFPWARVPVALSPQPLGFQWNGVASGMDNSPRFEGKDVFAVDALAQQGLNARYIALMAQAIGDTATQQQFQKEHARIGQFINEHYWDEADGFYYDLMPDGKTFSKVRTPASFWPVLAGYASQEKVARMTARLSDVRDMGGVVPWVTVSRSDPGFNEQNGNYWHGAMWLPTAYMGIRALTENGQETVADQTAEAVLSHMLQTYRNYTPHTIWECYNPVRPEPAYHGGNLVTPDFCGWSALGPISLFIENVLGFHSIDADKRVVQWRLHQAGNHGIRNLHFGDTTTDITTNGKKRVDVVSNNPFTLVVNGQSFRVKSGKNTFVLR